MLHRTIKLVLGLLAGILLGAFAPAFACSCYDSGPPCQAYGNADTIFVGKPIRASIINLDWNGHAMPFVKLRFRVSEALKGVTEREVDVVTNAQESACGYTFVPGTEYVVYGDRDAKKRWIGTGLCSRTRPLNEGREDVAFARAFAFRPPGGEVFGTAEFHRVDIASGDWTDKAPIANAKVTATGGSILRETTTGADGTYRLDGLPPGKYSIDIHLPDKLSPQRSETIELLDRGCAQIDYYATLNGRIGGRLLTSEGKSGYVKSVELVPLGSIKDKRPRTFWTVSNGDGEFELKDLPPGQYILGLNVGDAPDKGEPYQTTYYPATHDPASATIFTIGEGEKISGLDFRVPPALTERAITGTVVWPNGRPAVKATVDLTDIESGHTAGFGIKVDAAGRFTAPAYEGVRYRIHAEVPADPNWDPESGKGVELLVSPEQEITPNASAPTLQLVIDVVGDGSVRTQTVVRAPGAPATRRGTHSRRRKRPSRN